MPPPRPSPLPKKKPGRPPNPRGRATGRLNLKTIPREQALWQACARALGLTTTQWVITRLNRAAVHELGAPPAP